ncbi:LysE/ArgO family amino acid transporter [Micrococcus terreus]|uniref:LysE/ArgO family amino acid transporter n=1 Tax=Micrococcus terreus TaxID=574650 RepID=UPI0030189679
MWTTWTAGLLTGLALIVAIGAQNAFVLRQGIRREHVGVVVLVCLLSDALLILAGTAGIGVIVEKVPVVLEILRWGGAAYLIWFAVQSVRSAFSPTSLTPEKPRSKGSVLTTTLALTYLNPHVYLDTVVLLGSLANQQGPDLRWVFAGGAVVGSIVWFSALGYGARALAPVLDRPRAWQIVDLVIAAVMLALAVSLILR